MTDAVQPNASASRVQNAIQNASRATGVNFDLLVQTARRESALNPTARASTSSATGLFQFIESTWLDTVRKYGAEHGLGEYAQQIGVRDGRPYVADSQARSEILALRNDPDASARMAAELTQQNAATLQTRFGRAPNASELYAAHVMGTGGAIRLIEAAQSGAADASALFPREAAANRGLFFASGEPLSAQGVLEKLSLNADVSASSAVSATTSETPMSPGLAHALFAMALLPLLTGSDNRESDAFDALKAYARAQRAGL
ncbi:MAG: transglycosylase SLT domain-containing protein [Caulobacterales bacterium]